ncbi:hypothetical protein [Micromonospora psammae]|uniref:hypothetical protein n=1 Tax=Micromonospora sp. CPCC 205556 TaxID=3122398 RepID=UPI002FF1D4C7
MAPTSDGRVDLVEMLAGWRRRLPLEELGSAVVEAADEATRRRTEAWARGISSHAGGDQDAPETSDPSWLPASGLPVDESAINFARGLFYVLKDSSARLDNVATELANRAAVRAQWQSWPFDELDRMTADPFQLFANLGLMTRDPRGDG